MIMRGILFIIGFGLAVTGGVSVIGYLNLLAFGFNFKEYLFFIAFRPECYLLFIGIALFTYACIFPLKK